MSVNEYFTPSGAPGEGAAGSSATMRAEFQLLKSAFDLLPTMTGHANQAIFVNASGTALVATTAANALNSLGLGTIATQNANNVSITGGSITGLTNLNVATGNLRVTAGQLLVNNGTLSSPPIAFSAQPNTGFYQRVPGFVMVDVIGAEVAFFGNFGVGVNIAVAGGIGFSNGVLNSNAADTFLIRDASQVLAQKNLSSAQEFRVYGNTTNNKYISLSHDGTSGQLKTSNGTLNVPTAINVFNTLTANNAQITGGAISGINPLSIANAQITGGNISNNTIVAHTVLTNSLAADVALNNTSLFFDGPSVAQGTSGTWLVTGTVTVTDTVGGAGFNAKLWDGTTVIASARGDTTTTNRDTVTLSGVIASPAGNLRISVSDTTSTNGKILSNFSNLAHDSTITAFRIG